MLGNSAAASPTWRNKGWTGSNRVARFASHLATYRTLLDETGAPISVQQALMRHADIGTTMNVYGDSVAESQRKANSKVVSLLLSKKTV
jgi:integrase